ncbi:MAG: 1-(5-phosphoribosyl)-5-[(5-phosphoribosylamino)methylideneamino] imidazole-4-carboxamide isomerase [Actinobacteria bacterium]|nr:1-(5-phosphoribosyl)-5-[(5-phosphoribosylamino)methylideneamino] imidazole-4-carboxamide isomerase [Actinomycetota bacterium]
MVIYPAIDLREGKVVRLSQGDFGEETVYDADPALTARRFVEAGAPWLHVVDLDAARGTGDNHAAVAEVVRAVPVPVQVGGGVRDATLLDSGVARVVVGSLLLRDRPATSRLLVEARGRVALGLDHRDGKLRVSGWEVEADQTLAEVLDWDEVAQAAAVIVTDIATDGMLSGPNLSVLEDTIGRCPVPVICSGGVGGLDDIKAVRDTGAEGLIVGRALYEHRFTLEQALEAAR